MFDKLEDLVRRFEEITNELTEPSVVNDQNRFRKLIGGKIRELILKTPEGDGALVKKRFVRRLIANAVVHPIVYAPVFAVFHRETFSVKCRHEAKHTARVINLCTQVRRDQLNIAHQLLRLVKYVCVDLLENIAPPAIADNKLRAVDVPAAIGFVGDGRAGKRETGKHGMHAG